MDRTMRSHGSMWLLAACALANRRLRRTATEAERAHRGAVGWLRRCQGDGPRHRALQDDQGRSREASASTIAVPAVTLLSHVEIAVRFPIGGVLNEDDVDRGIRDCLKAGKACTGYSLSIKRINNDRVGDFWLDTFHFRRETESSGWTFTALILFVDERAVYAVYGGQPNVRETTVDRNPLGPLQGWGDWVSGQIYK